MSVDGRAWWFAKKGLLKANEKELCRVGQQHSWGHRFELPIRLTRHKQALIIWLVSIGKGYRAGDTVRSSHQEA